MVDFPFTGKRSYQAERYRNRPSVNELYTASGQPAVIMTKHGEGAGVDLNKHAVVFPTKAASWRVGAVD